MKSKFLVMLLTVPFLWAGLLWSEEVTAAERPNLVLILCDDLGYGDLSCYNQDSKVPTPHIDQLAREGMKFTQMYSPAAWCTPTRYGLLTGRYPFRVQTNWQQRSIIDDDRMTIGTLLQDQGYQTACIGKWHLGFDGGLPFHCAQPLKGGPLDRGFDHYYGIHASLDIPPYFFIRDRQCVASPTETIAASSESGVTVQYRGRFWREGKIAPGFDHDAVLDHLTDKAVEFLHTRKEQEEPFFLYYAMTAPHGPWVPGEEFQGKSAIGKYGDFLLHVDHTVGRVLQAVEELGEAGDNTIVILTSDNGPLWFDPDVEQTGHDSSAHFRGRKGDIWEGGSRMPFLVRWPGKVRTGSVSDEMLCLTDVLATVAAIVNQSIQEDAAEDSFNFLPVLQGAELQEPIREFLIHQSQGPQDLAIRQGEWKYIPWLGSGGFLTKPKRESPEPNGPTVQLYHISEDPGEAQNLALEHPRRAGELQQMLDQIRKGTRTRP